MAVKEIEIKLAWENDNFFQMDTKPVDGDWTYIIRIEENTDMASVWSHCADLCISYIRARLDEIGTEMMS